jgi:hypothetical protein
VVNRWRVILAAIVIFAAGAVTGGFAVRGYAPRKPGKANVSTPLPVSPERREDYLSRLDRELQLTPEQRTRIETILSGSQERMKKLWRSIEPHTKEEYQRTRKEISEILTPEQREKKKQMRQHGRENKAGSPSEKGERKPQACLHPKCKNC